MYVSKFGHLASGFFFLKGEGGQTNLSILTREKKKIKKKTLDSPVIKIVILWAAHSVSYLEFFENIYFNTVPAYTHTPNPEKRERGTHCKRKTCEIYVDFKKVGGGWGVCYVHEFEPIVNNHELIHKVSLQFLSNMGSNLSQIKVGVGPQAMRKWGN